MAPSTTTKTFKTTDDLPSASVYSSESSSATGSRGSATPPSSDSSIQPSSPTKCIQVKFQVWDCDLTTSPQLIDELGRWMTAIIVRWSSGVAYRYYYGSEGVRAVPVDHEALPRRGLNDSVKKLGKANYRTKAEFDDWLDQARRGLYTSNNYNPASINSNHFTDAAAYFFICEPVIRHLKERVNDLPAQVQREQALVKKRWSSPAPQSNSLSVTSPQPGSPENHVYMNPTEESLRVLIEEYPFVVALYLGNLGWDNFSFHLLERFRHRATRYHTTGQPRPRMAFVAFTKDLDRSRTDHPVMLDVWATGSRHLALSCPDESIAVALTKEVIKEYSTLHPHHVRDDVARGLLQAPLMSFNQPMDYAELIAEMNSRVEEADAANKTALVESRSCMFKVIEAYKQGRELSTVDYEAWRQGQKVFMKGQPLKRLGPFLDLLRYGFLHTRVASPSSKLQAQLDLFVDVIEHMFQLTEKDEFWVSFVREYGQPMCLLLPDDHMKSSPPAGSKGNSRAGMSLALVCQLIANLLANSEHTNRLLGRRSRCIRDALNHVVLMMMNIKFEPDVMRIMQTSCEAAYFNETLSLRRDPWVYSCYNGPDRVKFVHGYGHAAKSRFAHEENVERCELLFLSLGNWKDVHLSGGGPLSKKKDLGSLWFLLVSLFNALYLAPQVEKCLQSIQSKGIGMRALFDDLEAGMDKQDAENDGRIVHVIGEVKELLRMSGF